MSIFDIFLPSGTLRAEFERERSQPDDAGLRELLCAIAHVAPGEHFDPALVWSAEYLVNIERNLIAEERLNATLCVLALLIALGEGSTQLPLRSAQNSAQEHPDYLDAILARLAEALIERVDPLEDAGDEQLADSLRRASIKLDEIRQKNPSKVLKNNRLSPSILAKISNIYGEPAAPLLLLGGDAGALLTSERVFQKEQTIAEKFNARAIERSSADGERLRDALEALYERPTFYSAGGAWHAQRPNWEQAQAALLAAASPLTFVTGGPGTGKTTIVVTILRLLTRLGYQPAEIALAAPTGKAAYRMRQSALEQLGSLKLASASADPSLALDGAGALPTEDQLLLAELPEARTLHRLLEYSPGADRFWRNADNPIDARLVICDEASMIDLDMMHALMDALPDDAKLILVGDADQLPPVGSGAPFRDIIAHTSLDADDFARQVRRLNPAAAPAKPPTHTALADGPGPANLEASAPSNERMKAYTVRLHHSYRMSAGDPDGEQILRFAQAILACDSPRSRGARYLESALEKSADLGNLDALGGVQALPKPKRAQDEESAPERSANRKELAQLERFIQAWFQRFYLIAPDSADFYPALETHEDEFTPESSAALRRIFARHERARMLCITQVKKTGARAINRAFHALFAQQTEAWPRELRSNASMLHLEPVMMTQNNYQLNLFNGDQGIIAEVRERSDAASEPKYSRRAAIFQRADGSFRRVPIGQVSAHLELSYATSVHKSQGSEFQHVAMILPHKPMRLLTRELLYTGVTRASKSVTIYDPNQLFLSGAAQPLLRFTGLRDMLASGSRARAF